MFRRLLPLAALCTAALAAPAGAADVTYDVSAHLYLKGTAGGSYDIGWSSVSTWESEIDQSIRDVPATDDQDSIVGTPSNYRVFASRLKQDYTFVTDLETYTWHCVNTGDAKSTPGGLTMTRDGDAYSVDLIAGFAVTQERDCTGFSSAHDTIEITPGPLATDFRAPVKELEEKGYVSHQVDEKLPCGEWTIFQTSCDLRMQGSVTLTRRSAAPPEEPKQVKKVSAAMLPDNKGAAVKVTCAAACSGDVSATAVATKKLKAMKVGEKSFSSPSAGTRKVEIIFGGKGSRAVRRRGAVVIDVNSGGASRSTRIRAR